MKLLPIVMIGVMLLFNSLTAVSQNVWEVQFRPGINFTTENFAGADVETGYGFEVTAAYYFVPQLGAYAGWGWHEYRIDGAARGANPRITESGYTLGFQFFHPIADTRFSYVLQGGAIYNHLEPENNNREILINTEYNFGWQIGAGVDLPIGSGFHLRPTLRFRSLPGEIAVANGFLNSDLKYISFGIGLARRF